MSETYKKSVQQVDIVAPVTADMSGHSWHDTERQEYHLEPGQIRYLYLWVHPQWDVPWTDHGVDQEIEVYKKFIDDLKNAPRAALVQVADQARQDYQQNPVYARFIEQLKVLDEYAVQHLGERYVVWNESRFFDARKQEHVSRLAERLKLIESQQKEFVLKKERDMAEEPKFLARISVFGKDKGECSVHQATACKLHNLASVVRFYHSETPEGITPPTKKNPFPEDRESQYVFDRG